MSSRSQEQWEDGRSQLEELEFLVKWMIDELNKAEDERDDARSQIILLKNEIQFVKKHHYDIFDSITERAEKSEKDLQQAKEMLLKCSPWKLMEHPEAVCGLCGNGLYNGHKPNCKYTKMVGGV
jgi:chromosome segregation ATPase